MRFSAQSAAKERVFRYGGRPPGGAGRGGPRWEQPPGPFAPVLALSLPGWETEARGANPGVPVPRPRTKPEIRAGKSPFANPGWGMVQLEGGPPLPPVPGAWGPCRARLAWRQGSREGTRGVRARHLQSHGPPFVAGVLGADAVRNRDGSEGRSPLQGTRTARAGPRTIGRKEPVDTAW